MARAVKWIFVAQCFGITLSHMNPMSKMTTCLPSFIVDHVQFGWSARPMCPTRTCLGKEWQLRRTGGSVAGIQGLTTPSVPWCRDVQRWRPHEALVVDYGKLAGTCRIPSKIMIRGGFQNVGWMTINIYKLTTYQVIPFSDNGLKTFWNC